MVLIDIIQLKWDKVHLLEHGKKLYFYMVFVLFFHINNQM